MLDTATGAAITLPALSILRARVTFRLAEAARLPPFKGALFRGGLGYALQRVSCPPACWGRAERCTAELGCAYRRIFEPAPPPGRARLHDLQDAPRPFVVEPPLDQRREYAAGEPLELALVLFGDGIAHLPHLVRGLAELGHAGLGRDQARARLERVEALSPGQPLGTLVFRDGEELAPPEIPTLNLSELTLAAAELPADLHLALRTPLRVKARGAFIESLDLPALVQAIGWRLAALAGFYGEHPWDEDYRPVVEAARGVRVERSSAHWVDWERSSTRPAKPQTMKLGGIVGAATLRGVPPAVRAMLLAGGVVHAGKACVFGHGKIELAPLGARAPHL